MASAAGGHACLTKPYRKSDLLRGLDLVAEMAAHRSVHPPFPRGFQLLPSRSERAPDERG